MAGIRAGSGPIGEASREHPGGREKRLRARSPVASGGSAETPHLEHGRAGSGPPGG